MAVINLTILSARQVQPYAFVAINRTLDNNSGGDSYSLDIYIQSTLWVFTGFFNQLLYIY